MLSEPTAHSCGDKVQPGRLRGATASSAVEEEKNEATGAAQPPTGIRKRAAPFGAPEQQPVHQTEE